MCPGTPPQGPGSAGREMLCAAAILFLPQHTADLTSAHPPVVPTDGTTLCLTGDSKGGLLAGTAFAGNSSLPAGKTLCCDFSGCSSAIGGETKATLYSAINGSCPTPKVTATGETSRRRELDCHSAACCHSPLPSVPKVFP